MKLVACCLSIAGLVLPPLAADTVYLKNGAWIDGMVKSRSEKAIEIEIGSIGKVEVPADEIDSVEKNNRTGAETRKPSGVDRPDVKIITKDGKKVVSTTGGADAPGGDDARTSKPATAPGDQDDEVDEEAEAEIAAKVDAKKIDPELKARIDALVQDLQKHKPQFRSRAERHLKAIGQSALPSLLPLARHEADLTRTAVFRLFHELGDDSVIDSCIAALLDTNEYVRDYANKTLERVTGERFGYQPTASPRRREAGYEKWKRWWEKEKEELAEVEKLKG